MAPAASTVVPDVIEALMRVYAVRDEEDVRRFLAVHPDLLALLVEGPTRIPDVVADGRSLGIEVLRDGEDDDAEGVLFVTVPTTLQPDPAMPHMEDLLRGWLAEASRRSLGRFTVAWKDV